MARQNELNDLLLSMQTGLNQLIALSDEAEKVMTFHRTLLLWEIKADNMRTAYGFAKSIVWKTIERDFYLYVYSQLSYWLRNTYDKEDKENVKSKLQNALRKLKSILNSSVGMDLPSIVPQYRAFLRELDGCEQGLDSMTLEKATIENEALQLLEQTSQECGHNIRVYDRLNELSQASSFDKSLERLGTPQVGFQTPLRSVASASSLQPAEPPAPLQATSQPSIPRTLPDGETGSQVIPTSMPLVATAVTTEGAGRKVSTPHSFAVTRLAGPVGPHSSAPYSPRPVVGPYGSALRSPSAPNYRVPQPTAPPPATSVASQPPLPATNITPLDTSGQSSLYTNLMRPSEPRANPFVPTRQPPTTTTTMPPAEQPKPSSAEDSAYITIPPAREMMSPQPPLRSAEVPVQSAGPSEREDVRPFGYRANAAYFQAQEMSTRQAAVVPPPTQPIGFGNYGQAGRQPESSARMPTVELPPSPWSPLTPLQPTSTANAPQASSSMAFAEEPSRADSLADHTYTNSFLFDMVPVTNSAANQSEETEQPPATTMMPSLPPRVQADLGGPRMNLREFGMSPVEPEGQPSLPRTREPATMNTLPTSRPLNIAGTASITSSRTCSPTAESTRFFQQVEEKARQMANEPPLPAEPTRNFSADADENPRRTLVTNYAFEESESSVRNGAAVIDAESISSTGQEESIDNMPSGRLPIRREQMEIEMSSPETPVEREHRPKEKIIIARSSEKESVAMSRNGFQRNRSQSKHKHGHPSRQDSYTWEQNNETIRMVSGTSPISVALFSAEESVVSSPVDRQEQRFDYQRDSTASYASADGYRRTEIVYDLKSQEQHRSLSPQGQHIFKVVMTGPATEVPLNQNGTSESSSTPTGKDPKYLPVKLKVEPLVYESHHKKHHHSKKYGSAVNLTRENAYVCHTHCHKSRSPSPIRKQVDPCQQVSVQCARVVAECVPVQQSAPDVGQSVLLHHVCKGCQNRLGHGACLMRHPSLEKLSQQNCSGGVTYQCEPLENCVTTHKKHHHSRMHSHRVTDGCSSRNSMEYIGTGGIYANKAFMKCYTGGRACSSARLYESGAPIYAARSYMDLRG